MDGTDVEGIAALERGRLVYRWDLDKTYLRTEFDTMRDLVRTAFETASDKRSVPGAPVLLREIRATSPRGIFIVSGSPEHMRRVLEAKLRLDGIRWDGFTLKPQLRNLLRGRFRQLKDQVGYKLGALLESRASLPGETAEFLFGDDAEADAFIYSIYADICAGRVATDDLLRVLRLAGVYEDDLPGLVRLAERLPRGESGKRIFIHLDRISAPNVFEDFGKRVCPFYNYFQPALVLLESGAVDALAVLRVCAELIIHHAFTADALAASYRDLADRGHLGRAAAVALRDAIDDLEEAHFATTAPMLRDFGAQLAPLAERPVDLVRIEPPTIDYVALFDRDRMRAEAAKRRATGRA